MRLGFLISAIVLLVLGIAAVSTAMFLIRSKNGQDFLKMKKALLICTFTGAGLIFVSTVLITVAALFL